MRGEGGRAGFGAAAPAAPGIDWSSPWLASYRDIGQRVHARWLSGASVTDALNAEATPAGCGWPALVAGPLRFVPQADLPPATAYEAHIAQTACVPTRDNLHDFFNGLVWLHQPALKRRLNALQAADLARHGVGAQRGALRDRLTLFDENAACWAAPPRLADALRRRDWHALFVAHRADWAGALPQPVGHALLEKLCRPRKPITAHVWLAPPGAPDPAAWVLSNLLPDPLPDPASHPGAPAGQAAPPRPWPLPVLGVPGWWAGNEDPRFYDDPVVFRR